MKPGTIWSLVGLTAAAMACTIWIGRSASVPTKPSSADIRGNEQSEDDFSPPPISRTGPHPQAVVENPEYDFGVMSVGEEGKHIFVIRNQGEGPLVVKKGKTTCKCTLSKLTDGEVPPGGSVEIELGWEPRSVSDQFYETAAILTNDPNNQEIRLVIQGRVDALISMTPADAWNLGDVVAGEPVELSGSLRSTVLDEFQVLEIETSSPHLTAEHAPLDADELKKLQAKSGYEVKVKFVPSAELPVGGFQERVTIRTDARDDLAVTLYVRGSRPGPIRILPTPGVKWHGHLMALDMGQFSAQEGKRDVLSMFVSGLEEDQELEFLEVKSDTPFLKVALKPDPDFEAMGLRRYFLMFEVPPGSPGAVKLQREAARVSIRTNHPEAPLLRFYVEFVSI